MLIAPRHGFVFLAVHKTGSTAVERSFRSYAQLTQQRSPVLKHTSYGEFQRFLQPWLEAKGFGRDSYEVVCAIREPVDWLGSWWRYRSRDDLADPAHPRHGFYAGHLSFERFARAYMEGGERSADLGRPSEFLRPVPGGAGVDRVFRYDRLDLLAEFLRARVGEDVKMKVKNVSPQRSFGLSEGCERELRAYFAPEYGIYEAAIGGPGAGPPG